MANPNIVNVSQIYGKTTVSSSVTTTAQGVVTNSAGSNQIFKVNSLVVSNKDAANTVFTTVTFFRSSTDFNLAYRINIPPGSSLVVISKDSSIYLEEGDGIRIFAGQALALDYVCSYEIIS